MNRFTVKRGGDGALEGIDDDPEDTNFELASDERVTPALWVLRDGSARGDVGIGAVIDELYEATAVGVGPVGLLVAALHKTD